MHVQIIIIFIIYFYPSMTDQSPITIDSPPKLVKIAQLTPAHKKFNLLFELIEISSRDNHTLHCRVVDDTGIVNAFFNQYSQRLESGVVYHMTNLKCKVVNSHLQIQMTQLTSVTKEPDRLGFRDKANDISKKFYATRQQLEEVQKITEKAVSFQAANSLIPQTKQQVEEQIRLKKQFFLKMKNKSQQNQSAKKKQPSKEKVSKKNQKFTKDQNKTTPNAKTKNSQILSDKKITNEKKHYKEAENPKKQEKLKFKEKTTTENQNSSNKKIRYEEKPSKIEYKPKPESPKKKVKSNSIAYKLKQDEKQTAAPHQQKNQNVEIEYQRPKFVEKKQNCGEYMDLISVVAHVGAHVNLKVMICMNKRNVTENEYQVMIADKTGSVWLRVSKLNLEGTNWFEIDNLEVLREQGRLLLRETQFSEARQLDETAAFNLKPISGK